MSNQVESQETLLERVTREAKTLTVKEKAKLIKALTDDMMKLADGKPAAATAKAKAKAAAKPKASSSSEADADAEDESAVKNAIPVHLRQNHKWTAYVKTLARAEGWPEFVWNMNTTTKVLMPAGVKSGDEYVFPDLPDGHNTFSQAHAMSLATHWKSLNSDEWQYWEENVYEPDEEEQARIAEGKPKTVAKPKENTRKEMSYEDLVEKVEKAAAEEEAKAERRAAREAKKAAAAPKAEPKAEPKPKAEAKPKAAPKAASAASSTEEEVVSPAIPKRRIVKKVSEAEKVRKEWKADPDTGVGLYYYVDEDGKDVKCMRDEQDGIWDEVGNWIGELRPDNTVDRDAPVPEFDE